MSNNDIKIETLYYPESVRKRPGMYLGSTDTFTTPLREILNNAQDEMLNGYATKIVVVNKDNLKAVVDNGRGLPCYANPNDIENTITKEAITAMHSGSKFNNDNNEVTSGLHGVGSSVVNAVSDKYIVLIKLSTKKKVDSLPVMLKTNTDVNQVYYLEYNKGIYTDEKILYEKHLSDFLKEKDIVLPKDTLFNGWSTTVIMVPDLSIYDTGSAEIDMLPLSVVGSLFDNTTIIVDGNPIDNFDFKTHFTDIDKLLLDQVILFNYVHDNKFKISVKLGYDLSTVNSTCVSLVNLINTCDGGFIEQCLINGIGDALNQYNSIVKRADVKLGLFLYNVAFTSYEMSFSSQTKEKLVTLGGKRNTDQYIDRNSFIKSIQNAFYKQVIKKNKEYFDALCERIIQYKNNLNKLSNVDYIRSKITFGDDTDKKRSLTGDMAKIYEATSKDYSKRELYIPEGLSASGNLIKFRDKRFQSVLPIRGKLLNTTTVSENDLVDLKEHSAEDQYIQSSSIAKRKRFGQFFTPANIADVMSDWVLGCNPETLLDPAVGTGVLVKAIASQSITSIKCDAFDIDGEILRVFKAEKPSNLQFRMFNTDFLSHAIESSYDGVIMNPPYLRHHDLVYPDSIHDRISDLVGAPISRLSNAYVLFVMKACHLLSKGGRGAFIIPSEWTNANFGTNFKEYLFDHAGLQEVIYFTNCASVFDDALTTASILLVEKGSKNSTVAVNCVETIKGPFEEDTVQKVRDNYTTSTFTKKQLRAVPKWDSIFRYGKMKDIAGFVPLSDLGESKRGIATGANKYFHVSEVEAKNISDHHKKPCVGKASDVKGVVFTSSDYKSMKFKGSRSVLIDFNGRLGEFDKEYIKEGEAQGLHDRYLLSKRSPWYLMERRDVAPIWSAVFGRKNLRFIYNEANVYNLTTFHGFYPYEFNVEYIRALVCCLNSDIVQELAKANMRVYGGGLLKFEPRDILDIQVPDLLKVSKSTIRKLSDFLNAPEQARSDVDQAVLEAAEEATTSSSDLRSSVTFPPTGLTNAS